MGEEGQQTRGEALGLKHLHSRTTREESGDVRGRHRKIRQGRIRSDTPLLLIGLIAILLPLSLLSPPPPPPPLCYPTGPVGFR